jgi:hypothetical protein
MVVRYGLERELRWTLNLAVYGVGGVLLRLLERLRCGYGRISGNDGRISRVIPILWWEMDLELVFGIISGVWIWLLRHLFQFYLVLLM